MGCEIWIVPVVALAVWIITSLLKGSEEKPEPRRRPRDAEDRAQPPVELDKFLAEVRRRKQGSQQPRERPREEVPTALPAEPAPVRVEDRPPPGQFGASPLPAPRPRPVAPTPRQTPPVPSRRSRPAEAPPARTERQSARAPRRVERTPSGKPIDVMPLDVIPAESVLAADATRDSAEVGAAAKVHKARRTAQQEMLASLLNTPQQLRNAIILQEILSPPLCLRRHL